MKNFAFVIATTILLFAACEKKRVTHKPFSAKSPTENHTEEPDITKAPIAATESPADTMNPTTAPFDAEAPGPGSSEFHMAVRASRDGANADVFDLYLTSCQKGYLPGCHRYGWILEKKGNMANALNFYLMSCNSKYGKSCNNLGYYYETTNDAIKAKQYYSMACDYQHPGSCESVERLNKAH
jgi:hypothetical protein